MTMRVWSETDSTVTLVMEDLSSVGDAGATRFISDTSETLTAGQWHDVTFEYPSAKATGDEANTNYNQLVIRTGEGNTLYVDQIVMGGADVIDSPTTDTGVDDTTGGSGDGTDNVTPTDVETSSAFLAGPDAPDMDSADVVSLFSDEYTSALNGVIGWGDGVITEMDVNGNTVKKFDSSVWNIFDVPTDVSSGSAETLSITLFRTMSSDFEMPHREPG